VFVVGFNCPDEVEDKNVLGDGPQHPHEGANDGVLVDADNFNLGSAVLQK
jgi:hypothetical protein